MYDNFGISQKNLNLLYSLTADLSWLIRDQFGLLKVSQEICQTDPRSVFGGISSQTLGFYLCKVQEFASCLQPRIM